MLINNTHAATGANAPAQNTTGASSSTSSSSTGSASGVGGTTLGGTDFLTLMLAQLKNQDPTNPVDSSTFLTQLSELSEVQGITNLNTSFSALSSSLTSSQALQASSLLGHQVTVGSSTATLAANSTITGAVAVPQTSGSVKLNISNSAGELVQQINLGAQPAGIANFSWNGTQSDGSQAPPGQYSLAAQVDGVASGTAVNTYVSGTVQSVTMGGSGSTGLSLNVAGLGSVPFSAVVQISN
jgi:flagellar basal-body rod modification protein FlgD